ncbi:MAG: DUF1285 domain-containing protein [Gemmatimonas sp.]
MASASLNSDPLTPSAAHDSTAAGAAPFRISADGTWFYRGSAIQRPEMVRLFATVLRREADGYMLVTPYERQAVDVDDAPFVAVAMRAEDKGVAQLVFTTNVEREVVLSPEHPLIVRGTVDEPRPYIVVEPGIEARIARPVYYELAALAVPRDVGGNSPLGVWSAGAFFPLEPPRGESR